MYHSDIPTKSTILGILKLHWTVFEQLASNILALILFPTSLLFWKTKIQYYFFEQKNTILLQWNFNYLPHESSSVVQDDARHIRKRLILQNIKEILIAEEQS